MSTSCTKPGEEGGGKGEEAKKEEGKMRGGRGGEEVARRRIKYGRGKARRMGKWKHSEQDICTLHSLWDWV